MQIAPWVFPLTEESASVPPHVRGRELGLIGRRHQAGITPACAGKRRPFEVGVAGIRDHPRVCGEKIAALTALFCTGGSPPRVRGKASKRNRSSGGMWDHPRVCGEKVIFFASRRYLRGSPPRVRGKEWVLRHKSLHNGITPACAGKRRVGRRHTARGWDHPRVCGEKYVKRSRKLSKVGSPPRVRGKAAFSDTPSVQYGITPACAGKRTVYDFTYTEKGGSPPRVRGKGAMNAEQIFDPGITPVCAGKRGAGRGKRRPAWDHPRVCGEKKHIRGR